LAGLDVGAARGADGGVDLGVDVGVGVVAVAGSGAYGASGAAAPSGRVAVAGTACFFRARFLDSMPRSIDHREDPWVD